jgi:uncharacterized protein (DUF58 family)
VLLDASSSMAWPQPGLDKWVCGASVALGLCAVAFGDGDPIGLAVGGVAEPVVLPPRARRDTVARIRSVLAGIETGGSAPLAPLLPALRACRRIAIVSDFLGDEGALLERARELLAQGREVHAVHVVAREELDPGPQGIVVDPEQPALRRTLDVDHVAGYRARFDAWRAALSASWHRAGASFNTALTGEAPERIIRRVTAPAGLESAR